MKRNQQIDLAAVLLKDCGPKRVLLIYVCAEINLVV